MVLLVLHFSFLTGNSPPGSTAMRRQDLQGHFPMQPFSEMISGQSYYSVLIYWLGFVIVPSSFFPLPSSIQNPESFIYTSSNIKNQAVF
jgi:hypothetical protein